MQVSPIPPLPRAAALGVTPRLFTDADLPFVEALYASTRAEEVAQTGWPPEMQRAFLTQQHQAQHFHYGLVNPDMAWLILEQAGAPIGRLYLDERSDRFHIVDVSLMPASRGGGIGRAILEDVQERARNAGKGISINVEKMNPARRLYERVGFGLVEDQGIYDLLGWGIGPNGVSGESI